MIIFLSPGKQLVWFRSFGHRDVVRLGAGGQPVGDVWREKPPERFGDLAPAGRETFDEGR